MSNNKYTRIPDTETLGIYLGEDDRGRSSMFIKLSKKPSFTLQNKHLHYECNKRSDNLWALTVSIIDEAYISVFYKLVFDLVDTLKEATSTVIAERLFIKRFTEWQKLFEQSYLKKLNQKEIIGLIGELFFLDKYIIPRYGELKGINSWCGPLGTNKDFIIDNLWFEVKTKSVNNNTIHISNESQLKSKDKGYLCIVEFEYSSPVNILAFNLISLYHKILNSIDSKNLKIKFQKKLSLLNFSLNKEYEEINLEFTNTIFYIVDKNFPKIANEPFEKVFINLKYEIFLPGINEFKVESPL